MYTVAGVFFMLIPPSETITPGVLFRTPSVEPSVSAVFSILKIKRSGFRITVGFVAMISTCCNVSDDSFKTTVFKFKLPVRIILCLNSLYPIKEMTKSYVLRGRFLS